ncbi:MAG: LapA family protein [Proteobacteria bacterium]|nr:LapA family protein [Pseudomonadota bacterium]
MQVLRTLVWVVLTALLVAFIAMNWHMAEVHFWPMGDGYLRFDWPVGFIALFFFALGFVPMWLRHKLHRWSANRRIATLETSLRAAAPAPPLATSTQLDAAEQD